MEIGLPGAVWAALDYEGLTTFVGNLIYAAQALVALWGLYCVVMVWMRVGRQRFRSDAAQTQFLAELDAPLQQGDFPAAMNLCDGDPRAVPQLSLLALQNWEIGYAKVKHLVMERFQRDVLSDIEQRCGWINTVIKSEPMLGLFGTVVGMMGAFSKLAAANNVEPKALASDISVALITTAIGLAISVPLILVMTAINIRIRKMEDAVGSGVGHVLDTLREVTAQAPSSSREVARR